MSEKIQERVSYDDNIVIVPVELARDLKVPGEGVALYTIMKSFGKRAEAKVETYGVRLGWFYKRVRKYQRLLQKEGWIFLLREGDADRPRLWWMCRFKGQVPTQEEVEGVTKIGLPKIGGPETRGPQNRPPQNGTPKQKKVFKQLEGCANSQKGQGGAKAPGNNKTKGCRECGSTGGIQNYCHSGMCENCYLEASGVRH